MPCSKTFALSIAALLAITAPAFAGVTGDISVKSFHTSKDGKKTEEISKGRYTKEGTKVFVEHQAQAKAVKKPAKADSKDKAPAKRREPAKQAFYLDQSTWKATKILHVQKRFMDIDLTQNRSWEQGFWNQFLTMGAIPVNAEEFKKKGIDVTPLKDEKVGGQLCAVWTLKRLNRGTLQEITIWQAKEMDNAPMKILVKVDGEKKSEFLMTNVKKSPVDMALFTPPKDYTAYQPKIMVGSMPDMKKGGATGQVAKPARKL